MHKLRSRNAGFAIAVKKRLVKDDDNYNSSDDILANSLLVGPLPIPLPTKMATKSNKVANTATEDDEADEDEMEKDGNTSKAAVPVPEGQDTLWENFIEIFDPVVATAPFLPSSSSSNSNSSASTTSARFYMNKAVPYFFLRDELGINENKMLRISLDNPQVLALSVERSLRPKVAWLRSALGLTQAEAATLVGGSPGMLLLSVEDNLAPKLSWLQDELGFETEERRKLVMRCPQVLTTSPGSLLMKLAFLKDDVGMSRGEVYRAVRSMPSLLVLSLDTLVDKAEYLTAEFGVTQQDVGSLLTRAPALFFQSLEAGLKPKARFLRRDLGLDTDAMAFLLRRMPRALNYNIVSSGRPLLQYLTRGPFNFTREEVARIILRSPSLLSTDVTSPRFGLLLESLQQATNLPLGPALASILRRFPMILSFTASRLHASLDVLTDDLKCSSAEIASILQKHPQLLGYRPVAVREKLAALQEIYGLSEVEEGKKAVLRSPALLSYSLDTRLRPRLLRAAETGVELERAVSWLPLTEEKFEERVVKSSTEAISLANTPLLRHRSNAKLRKLLRTTKRSSSSDSGGSSSSSSGGSSSSSRCGRLWSWSRSRRVKSSGGAECMFARR